MTCIHFTGGESLSTQAASILQSSEGIVTTPLGTTPTIVGGGFQRSGVGCFKAAANAQSQNRRAITKVDGRGYFYQIAYRIDTAFPSSTVTIAANPNFWQLRMNTSGQLIFADDTPTQIGSASAAVTLGTYFVVEIFALCNTAADDTVEVRLNGVTFVSATQAISAVLGNNFDVGPQAAYGASREIYWDDVVVNDDQGAAPSNTWPGSARVVSSLPISDQSRTDWTDANGGTSNLWDCLNNRAPEGTVLTLGTPATKQIRNAVSSATGNLVVNMQSMNAAGVGSSDDILGTSLRAICSCDSGTATNGSLEILATNGHPAQAESSVDWTTPGVAGTYPSGWQNPPISLPVSSGIDVMSAPSITDRSVSPRVEIGKRTATTRALGVCQCRLDICYRPAAVAAVDRKPIVRSLQQARNRASRW